MRLTSLTERTPVHRVLASFFRHATLSSRLQLVNLRHRTLSTAPLVHRSTLNNVSYHKSGYHLFADRAPIDHLHLVLSSSQPFTESSCLRTSDNRLQDTSILRSAQMFVRCEVLPSLTDSKDNQIQILYYVHVR